MSCRTRIRGLGAVALSLSLAAAALSCRQEQRVTIKDSRLYQDLHDDHRDSLYRALIFIHRHGGPSVPDSTTLPALVARREQADRWLLAQSDTAPLLADYEQFSLQWSPILGPN